MRQYIKFFRNLIKRNRVISDRLGLRYYFSSTDALTLHIAKNGIYGEYQEIEALLSEFDISTGVAIDVGANVGLMSLPLALKFKQVYSFEPDPDNAAVFKKNSDLNQLKNITLCQEGVADQSGSLELSINRSIDGDGMINTGISSLHSKNRVNSKRVVSVPVTTLDEFIEKNSVGDLSLIKIDTEGYDHLVLKGARKTLAKFKPAVFYEYSNTLDQRTGSSGREASLLLLEELRYRHFRLNQGVVSSISKEQAANLSMDVNLFAIYQAE